MRRAIFLLILLVPSAAAHAVYQESSPAKGERLEASPHEVWVLLTEPVDPGTFSFVVTNADGQVVSQGEPTLVASPRARLSVALQPNLPTGPYLATWRVLSTVDGHFTSGSTGFAVGDASPPPSGEGETTQTSPLAPWVRFASFLGMAAAAGSLLFLVLARDAQWAGQSLRRLAVAGCAANLASVALLFWDTSHRTGLSPTHLLETSVGQVLAVRLVASLAALALAARLRGTRAAAAVAVALVGAAGASARLGHASLAGASAILVDLMHLLAVEAWLGGLFAYVALLMGFARRGEGESGLQLGRRFSPWALGCVLVITVTGFATTWTITRDYLPLHLLDDPWGRFLALKVALMAGMVALAGLGRYLVLAEPGEWPTRHRFTQGLHARMRQGDAAQRVRRLVQAEAILGVGALFLAGLLTSISPPALAAPSPVEEGVPVEAMGQRYMLVGAWDGPLRAGQASTLEFHLMDHHHGMDVANNTCGRSDCLLLEVQPPGNGTGAQVYAATPDGNGTWRTDPVLWVTRGTYETTLKVQTADVYLEEIRFSVAVG